MGQKENKPDSLVVLKQEHRRLAILRHLSRAPRYRLNELLLDDLLTAIGLTGSVEELRSDLELIVASGLAERETVGEIQVFRLTQSGLEVAEGMRSVEGVLKPPLDCRY